MQVLLWRQQSLTLGALSLWYAVARCSYQRVWTNMLGFNGSLTGPKSFFAGIMIVIFLLL